MFNKNIFSKNIKKMRIDIGLSSYEFAIQADIGYSNYSKIETGVSNPSLEVALHILNYFHMGFNESLGKSRIEMPLFDDSFYKYLMNLNQNDLYRVLEIVKIIGGNEYIEG